MAEVRRVKIESGAHQELVLQFYRDKCHNETLAGYAEEEMGNGTNQQCPGVWDGLMCWPRTPAGVLSTQPCPAYVVGLNSQASASKQCAESGEWFVHPVSLRRWTNLSECSHSSVATIVMNFHENANVSYIEDYMPVIKAISQAGYSVSTVALVIAFSILISNKRLRCPRNVLHMHLFVSFVLRASIVLLKDWLFVHGVGLSSDLVTTGGDTFFSHGHNAVCKVLTNMWHYCIMANYMALILMEGLYLHNLIFLNAVCKVLTSVWHYCIMANYSLILMEGLYLHNLIFLALFCDTSSIKPYVLLGWGLPYLFVVPWVAVRTALDDSLCWNTNHGVPYISLLIEIPITLSVIINTVLFVNIVRVLFVKIKATVSEQNQTYRRLAKSTLVLVPLFGVHYTLFLGMSNNINTNPTLEIIWLFGDQLFASFQGFFVAVLYCFMNGEVRSEMKKKWYLVNWLRPCNSSNRCEMFSRSYQDNHPRASCYSTTSCTSISVSKYGDVKSGLQNKSRRSSLLSCQLTENKRPSYCSTVGPPAGKEACHWRDAETNHSPRGSLACA